MPGQLMEYALKEDGLYDISRYIQHKTGKPIIICDGLGRINVATPKSDQVRNEIMEIPEKPLGKNYVYDQGQHYLYYLIGIDYIQAVVIITDLSEDKVESILPFLGEINMPLRIYFTRYEALERAEMHIRNQLVEDLLVKNIINIKDIIKKSGSKLDSNRKYFVVLYQMEKYDDFESLYLYSKEWLRIHDLDIIVSPWMNSMQVYICPTHYRENTLEEHYLWEKTHKAISKQKKEMKEKFGVELSSGGGQIYPLEELHKSYQQAQIALVLSELLAYHNDNKHFLDFGIFSLIFMLDLALVKKYCYDSLVILLEYDLETDGELLDSLRLLFKNNMNWKNTADGLFVHINTLRYRINKIEELLSVDFNNTHTKANLFVALIIYDTLEAIGYICDE